MYVTLWDGVITITAAAAAAAAAAAGTTTECVVVIKTHAMSTLLFVGRDVAKWSPLSFQALMAKQSMDAGSCEESVDAGVKLPCGIILVPYRVAWMQATTCT